MARENNRRERGCEISLDRDKAIDRSERGRESNQLPRTLKSAIQRKPNSEKQNWTHRSNQLAQSNSDQSKSEEIEILAAAIGVKKSLGRA